MKKAFIQLHIAVFLAGFTGILGRLIQLNEIWLVWYRLLFTSIAMWIMFSITRKLIKLESKDIIKLIGLGFLSALHWVAFYSSIKQSNVSVALVCFSSVGFFTALLEPLLLKKPVNWMDVSLGLLVILGIYVIFQFDGQYKLGIILGVTCAILLAIAIIIFRQFVHRSNPETVLTWQMTGGLISLSILIPVFEWLYPSVYILPTWKDIQWLLILSIFCSLIAFQLTGYALKKLSAFTVNLSFNLEPVYGIILAFVIYHENRLLNKWFFAGFALIAVSLILHVYFLLKEHPKQPLNGVESLS
jgi:drug/metabolite transporter (DMT)-like permease